MQMVSHDDGFGPYRRGSTIPYPMVPPPGTLFVPPRTQTCFAFSAIKRHRAGFHNQRNAVCRTAPVDSSAQE
ncbi:MAG: hypothetical protein ACRDIV_00385 [Ktedonobacteraceae bacterium]